MKFNIERIISISILLITLSSIANWTDLPIDNTFVWWFIYFSILAAFLFFKRKHYDVSNDKQIKTLRWYLIWNIICIVRGAFVADNYWQWKNLVGMGMVLLLPLSIYVSTNKNMVQKITSTWLKYALPAFFIFLPFMRGEALGRYLVPISFILLFFPILTYRWKIIAIFFALFVLLGDLNARSNVIKFGVPIVFSMLYYFRYLLHTRLINVFRITFMFAPFFLFFLAAAGIFNVFKINQYLSGNYTTKIVTNGEVKEADLTDDTRTFLYVEVLNSAIKYDYSILGRTPARGNESPWYYDFSLFNFGVGQKERIANEVSILNIFTWTGVVGVILYFLVFYQASFLAVNKSNNYFMRIVGLCVAFRWIYAWIEDFSRFDLSFVFLWLMIGMCFSKSFRSMSDKEMKYWVLGLFDIKYRKVQVPSIRS